MTKVIDVVLSITINDTSAVYTTNKNERMLDIKNGNVKIAVKNPDVLPGYRAVFSPYKGGVMFMTNAVAANGTPQTDPRYLQWLAEQQANEQAAPQAATPATLPPPMATVEAPKITSKYQEYLTARNMNQGWIDWLTSNINSGNAEKDVHKFVNDTLEQQGVSKFSASEFKSVWKALKA